MYLVDLKPNETAIVTGYLKTSPAEVVLRLGEIGFGSGESVTCLRKGPLGGPNIYQIGDGVFALDRELAAQVLVQLAKLENVG